VTGFNRREEYPDLVVRPVVEEFGGLWKEDQSVIVDNNLISSRHPDDIPQFTAAIREWLNTTQTQRKRA
jgi:putative intracellular protease/amidase